LLRGQDVGLLVDGPEAREEAIGDLVGFGVDAGRVRIVEIPTADTWIRDYGPTFLLNDETGEVGMVEWQFNAWGGKYDDLIPDDGLPSRLNRHLGLRVWNPGVVMEGGSIEVNGRGTVLTTTQCLLNPNRNPGLDRAGIERVLTDYLNAPNVLWLGEGIVGDDTDGHIDDIARFVDETTIVCAIEGDPDDANHALLHENYRRLEGFRDQDHRAFRIATLPMPDPVVADDGARLPASYANFTIGNRVVLVPVFDQLAKDARALEVLRGLFPSRGVVGIDCRAMVHGLGTIHCSSQQQPRGKKDVRP
jgi:agmatine deiminase